MRFEDSVATISNTRFINENKSDMLLNIAERYLANLGLDTKILEQIDAVQSAQNFAFNMKMTDVDRTYKKMFNMEKYLTMKQDLRLKSSQSITQQFISGVYVIRDTTIANKNFQNAVNDQMLSDIAVVDASTAAELREKVKQSAIGLDFAQLTWLALAVGGVILAIALLKSKK